MINHTRSCFNYSKLSARSIPAISSHVQNHNEIKTQILWPSQPYIFYLAPSERSTNEVARTEP